VGSNPASPTIFEIISLFFGRQGQLNAHCRPRVRLLLDCSNGLRGPFLVERSLVKLVREAFAADEAQVDPCGVELELLHRFARGVDHGAVATDEQDGVRKAYSCGAPLKTIQKCVWPSIGSSSWPIGVEPPAKGTRHPGYPGALEDGLRGRELIPAERSAQQVCAGAGRHVDGVVEPCAVVVAA